jgi:hypothetical protein
VKKLSSSICILLGLIAVALSRSASAQVIQISNVEELYSAVNDPANAGATLVLSSGTYLLSVSDSNNLPRPKGGRIELQPDMSIIGVEGDRSLVVINAINLPKSSFPTGANGPNAAVRMGLGHNALEWLTVRDTVNGQANIDTGLQPLDSGTAYVLVAHIASTGSARGLNLINYGPRTSGQTIEADIIDSYFFENTLGISEGIRIGNFAESQGTVNVRMNGNLSWGQQAGRIIETSGATNSTINVLSSGNRFYGNGTGTIIFGGVTGGLSPTAGSDGNTINFEAHGDQFIDNTGNSATDHGGLLIRGLENVSTATGGTNNTVNIALWGCRMLRNTETDLYAVGAHSTVASTAPLDQNNQVTIEIHGDGNGNGKWQPVEFFANSLPSPPDYWNLVTVIDE